MNSNQVYTFLLTVKMNWGMEPHIIIEQLTKAGTDIEAASVEECIRTLAGYYPDHAAEMYSIIRKIQSEKGSDDDETTPLHNL